MHFFFVALGARISSRKASEFTEYEKKIRSGQITW